MSHSSSEISSGHHIVPISYYIGTFGGLIVLTLITVAASRIHFGGALNIIIAMGIACLKAMLVILFFMGLKWDKGFNRVAFFASLLFLMIFITFTLSDILTRGSSDSREIGNHSFKTPVKMVKAGEHS